MRNGQSRSNTRWIVLAATALSVGFAAEASAQFGMRGGGGMMTRAPTFSRPAPIMKPPTMRVTPAPVVRSPIVKLPRAPGGPKIGGTPPVKSPIAKVPRAPEGPKVGGHPPPGAKSPPIAKVPPAPGGPKVGGGDPRHPPSVGHHPPPRGPGEPPHHPRFPPHGPVFVAPIIPGVIGLPPAIIEPPGEVNVVSPPPGFGGGPPPQQTAQPPSQPPRRTTTGVPPSNERRYVPDEVVIEVDTSFSVRQAEALARRMRLARLDSFTLNLSGTTIFRWRILDRRTVPAVVRALETIPDVRNVQPNYLFGLAQDAVPQKAALTTSTGESVQLQYALGKLKLQQAHNIAKGDKILIAVIDSGVDADHPELAGMVAGQLDAVGGPGPKAHTHGTAIAGTIVARAKLMGVAPSARILAVRAFGGPTGSGDATTFAILKGLDWATSRGARVVNMSFAGPPDPAIGRNIAIARQRGVVLVAAAGNAGPRSAPLYPAADSNVIAVTATDADDKIFAKANRGQHIAVAAPGVDILLPAPNAAYQVSSGTSFSAAFVSGTVALLLERKPDLSPDAVRRVLLDTAADLGPKGMDDEFGAGLVDAFGALSSLAPAAGAETATVIPAAAR